MSEDSKADDFLTRVSGVEIKIGSLESDVRNLSKIVGGLNTTIHELSKKITQQNRTEWGVLGTWATVVVAAITGFGIMAISPVSEQAALVTIRQYQHEKQEGHVGALKEVQAMAREIAYLNQVAQKEFTLARTRDMDQQRYFQREIDRIHKWQQLRESHLSTKQ